MKKLIALSIALLLVAVTTVAAVAAPGQFIASPSGNAAPVLVDGINESDGCTAEIEICAYVDRAQLSDEKRAELEEAYAQIAGAQDLATLNADLKAICKDKKISTDQLAVSDLFDISYKNCDPHYTAPHGAFAITLRSQLFKNMVALLHYEDGAWVVVEDAELEADGTELVFMTDDLSPFAVVVFDGEELPAQTNCLLIFILLLLLLLLLIALLIYLILKKNKGKDVAAAAQAGAAAQASAETPNEGDGQSKGNA